MGKKVKMADIADRLGVSTVTVSKALSGKSGVSDSLREKIESLADEMGYEREFREIPEQAVSIGVIVEERYVRAEQSFYWNLYQVLSGEAISKNASAYIEVITEETEQNLALPKLVEDSRIDGLIIMGTFYRNYREFLKENVAIPIIFLDADSGDSTFDSVMTDNILGGLQMTNYLFEKGYKKIGYVGKLDETDSIDDRFLGFMKSSIIHHAKPVWKWNILDRDETGRIFSPDEWKIDYDDIPDAFFCNCDVAAISLVKRFQNDGLKVPEDIAVAGFDNYIMGGHDEFLTTYAISSELMAKRAIHIMLNKISDSSYLTGKFVLGGQIIVRRSA